MTSFLQRFEKIEEAARLTPDGKQFSEAGFRLYANGGNLTAWRRDVDEKRYILVTDSDGASHELSDSGHAFIDGAEDAYLVGLHSDDDDFDECEVADSVQHAIKIAEDFSS